MSFTSFLSVFLEESNMDFNLVGLKLGADTQPMHGPEFSRHGKVPVPAHPIRHIGIKNMLRHEDFFPVQNCCCLRVAPSRNNGSSVDGGGGTILYKFNRISFPDGDHLLSNTSLLLSNFCKGVLLLYEKRCENLNNPDRLCRLGILIARKQKASPNGACLEGSPD